MSKNVSVTDSGGKTQAAPDGSRGFDADSPVSLAMAQRFAGEGYTFCLRYLSLEASAGERDLRAEEAQHILDGGLALMPVQHVLNAPWMPAQELGTKHGLTAAIQARAIGVPAQTNVWLDLEGVDCRANAHDVIAYCNAWYEAVASAGYLPGVYVGASCGFTGQQLYDLPFRHYWRSLSRDVPAIPVRDYQMVQSVHDGIINGVSINLDTTSVDRCGGVPQWWTKALDAI